jgi:hypothetical protein
MKVKSIIFGLLLVCLVGSVQAATDYSGTWVMNAKKGENLGMMAALEQTLIVTQTDEKLTLDFSNVFRGQTTTRQVTLDLGGAVVDNVAGMGDPSKTESVWDGSNLVTTWTTASAIPGSEVVRTETHALSADGATLSVTIERENSPTMVLVYEKQ